MSKKIIIRLIGLGIASWLIPFAISFFFYKPDGTLVVSYSIFKSTINLVGVTSGCYLLLQFFKVIDKNFVKNGIIAGLCWLSINIILDVIILIPMMKTTFTNYLLSIGISYFSIPAISIAMGYLVHLKLKQAQSAR